MHLLSAQSAQIQTEDEAIDLEQEPGRIIFASFADNELANIASAVDRAKLNDFRLANISMLAHNLSIDLWLEKTVSHAKLIIIRLLGGVNYWQYGIDELCALAQKNNIKLALLPGDANIDNDLLARSTISKKDWHILHSLFVAGGAQNMDLAIKVFDRLARDKNIANIKAKPFLRFGFYSPCKNITLSAPEKWQGADNNFVPILFYRSLLEGAGGAAIDLLCQKLKRENLTPVPIIISSLKEGACVRFVKRAFEKFPPQIILNLTAFALGIETIEEKQNPFADIDAPIIQLLQSSRPKKIWQKDYQGLSAKDLAMQIVLPELDGRIGNLLIAHKEKSVWHKRTQCQLSLYSPYREGIKNVVELSKNWLNLRFKPQKEKKIALILANYPIRDGRLANGVGYDAPQSTIQIMKLLKKEGYKIKNIPKNGNELIKLLQKAPTNANPKRAVSEIILPLAKYNNLLKKLPKKIQNQVNKQWGKAQNDVFCRQDGFHLPIKLFGNLALILQPSRGYNIDIEANYHDPDLVPTHAYIATYLWAKYIFGANALIHNGKHGNLEWLPGKANALDNNSYPLMLWGCLPHFYPFIVNDPGEGSQAKRRTGAVIIDHLVPPLTRAEIYGVLKDLEALLDEYYQALGMDKRRLNQLRKNILNFIKDINLDKDLNLPKEEEKALEEIDNYLCELKEAQIRDGLHIFGQSPKGELLRDLIIALSRVPRGENLGDGSFIRALSDDLKLGFDPLSAKLGEKYIGPKPKILANISKNIWRTNGDSVERLEMLAAKFVEQKKLPANFAQSKIIMQTINKTIRPKLSQCGKNEEKSLIDGLNGKFVAPGPSGSPSRGRLDVLPTGRNFYSIDNRALPTQLAWELGKKSAQNLLERHFQAEGIWLKSVALSVWGTSNMRTGGDDIAQALALIGAKPKWDFGSLRVSGFEIIPLAKLGRPRVDVTLRISGFFRDAFPLLIDLFDSAVRAIGMLDEPKEQNPIAFNIKKQAQSLIREGKSKKEAYFGAAHRIFGAKPGAYGAGLQGLIDSGSWQNKKDLSKAFVNWGQYAYGAKSKGLPEIELFKARLGQVEAIIHNQDNREHDLLDSDDYYQFEGGLFASVETIKGQKPFAYHNDHSRPENPKIKTLEEEISFVVRSRLVNPKWIKGVMRHGYKGAFEIIASFDYMFAFAATTGAVKNHHFDLAFDAFIKDEKVRNFLEQNNAHGFKELKNKFNEAIERKLWQPKSNSVFAILDEKND